MNAFLRKFNRPWLVVSAISVLAVVLRLVNIKAEPLWGDEILSLDIVLHFSNSILSMLDYLRQVEFHPPLYYVMLNFWIDLFGSSTLAVRSLSLVFGILLIPAVYKFAQELYNSRKIGYIAAFLTAILPMQIEFGQEARPYTIYAFLATVAAYAIWKYFQQHRAGYLIMYAAFALAGLYVHYSFAFFLAAIAIWWLIRVLFEENRRLFLDWLLVHAAILVGFSYWLDAFLYKNLLSSFDILGPRNFYPFRPVDFVFYVTDQLIWLHKKDSLQQMFIVIKLLSILTLVGGAIGLLLKNNKKFAVADWVKTPGFMLVLITLIQVVLFILSPQSSDYASITVKHIIFATVSITMLLAWLIAQLPVKTGISVAAIFLFSLVPFNAEILGNDQDVDHQFNLKLAAEMINELYQPGDILLITGAGSRSNTNHYLRPEIEAHPISPIPHYGLDVWNSRQTLGLIENEHQVRIQKSTPQEIELKLDRLNLMYKPQRIWLYGFTDNDQAVYRWFDEHGWKMRIKPIGDVFYLHMYAKN